MSHPLRIVAADDEPLARERLRDLLAERDDVTLVAEARNGQEALDAVRQVSDEGRPADLLLLDVEMPELDGLEVLAALAPEERPSVVFVTAYDRYAVQAFDLHALDYVLKPFDDDRFHEALDRAVERRQHGEADTLSGRLLSLLRQSAPSGDAAEVGGDDRLTRIAVRTGDRYHLVDLGDVDWIEGAGVYARLVAGDKSHLVRTSLSALETRLDPARFLRVHRSTIANLDRVREVRPHAHGEYVLILEDGTRLKVSRTYSDGIRAFLDKLG